MGSVSDFSSIPSPGTPPPPTTGRIRAVPIGFQLPSSTDFSTPSQLKETVEKQLNNSPVPQLEKRKKIFYAAAAVAAVVAIVGACVVAWPLAALLILSASFLVGSYLAKQQIGDEKEKILRNQKESVDLREGFPKEPPSDFLDNMKEIERERNREITAALTKETLPTDEIESLIGVGGVAIGRVDHAYFKQVCAAYRNGVPKYSSDFDNHSKDLLATIDKAFAGLKNQTDSRKLFDKLYDIDLAIEAWINRSNS